MSAFAIVAPSDAQLRYIVRLCERRNLPRPRAVHSFQEAGELPDEGEAELRYGGGEEASDDGAR